MHANYLLFSFFSFLEKNVRKNCFKAAHETIIQSLPPKKCIFLAAFLMFNKVNGFDKKKEFNKVINYSLVYIFRDRNKT